MGAREWAGAPSPIPRLFRWARLVVSDLVFALSLTFLSSCQTPCQSSWFSGMGSGGEGEGEVGSGGGARERRVLPGES